MIELTQEQAAELEQADEQPLRVLNPRTQERFVLVRHDVYERLMEEYDDSPWSQEEIQSLAWSTLDRRGDEDEYDSAPEGS